jgi:hypothetical protein
MTGRIALTIVLGFLLGSSSTLVHANEIPTVRDIPAPKTMLFPGIRTVPNAPTVRR